MSVHIMTKPGHHIVLIDDSRLNMEMLDHIVRKSIPDPVVHKFSNPTEALRHIKEYAEEISLIITDYRMPGIQGDQVVSNTRLQPNGIKADIPILVITAAQDRNIRKVIYDAGATDFIRRPFDEELLKKKIVNYVLMRQRPDAERIEERIKKEREAYSHLLARMFLVTRESAETTLRRTEGVTEVLCNSINADGAIKHRAITLLRICDLGKIGLPNRLHGYEEIDDTFSLSDKVLFRTHVQIGYELLLNGNTSHLRSLAEPVKLHHEQWDGSGYLGVTGENIPIESRIVRLSLDLEEYYRNALKIERNPNDAFEEAIGKALENSGTRFDPTLIRRLDNTQDILLSIFTQIGN